MSRSPRPTAFDVGLRPKPAGAPARLQPVAPGRSFLEVPPHNSPSGPRHRASAVFSGHPCPGPAARFLLALRARSALRRPFSAGSSLRSSGHPWPRHPCRPAGSCRGIHAAASGFARTRVNRSRFLRCQPFSVSPGRSISSRPAQSPGVRSPRSVSPGRYRNRRRRKSPGDQTRVSCQEQFFDPIRAEIQPNPTFGAMTKCQHDTNPQE